MRFKNEGGDEMLRYRRTMHGREWWTKVELLENVSTPL